MPSGRRYGSTPAFRTSVHRERANKILDILAETHPDATCALHYRNAYELVSATILSAQCTDKRVNSVTPALFARYPDARAFADAFRLTGKTPHG